MNKKEWHWMDKVSGGIHHYNEGKEYLRKDKKFDYQGKSKKQYEGSALGAFVGFLGIIIILVIAKLLSL